MPYHIFTHIDTLSRHSCTAQWDCAYLDYLPHITIRHGFQSIFKTSHVHHSTGTMQLQELGCILLQTHTSQASKAAPLTCRHPVQHADGRPDMHQGERLSQAAAPSLRPGRAERQAQVGCCCPGLGPAASPWLRTAERTASCTNPQPAHDGASTQLTFSSSCTRMQRHGFGKAVH